MFQEKNQGLYAPWHQRKIFFSRTHCADPVVKSKISHFFGFDFSFHVFCIDEDLHVGVEESHLNSCYSNSVKAYLAKNKVDG